MQEDSRPSAGPSLPYLMYQYNYGQESA